MAADGQVLRLAEAQAMEQGRELTRKMLEVSLEQEGREVEKKSPRPDVRLRTEQVPSWT